MHIAAAIRALFNAAGGLPYHLLALRHRKHLWTAYRLRVGEVLAQWSPPQRDLLVVGPSAGWLLPSSFLEQFQIVYAVEPDPVARWLLRRRFPRVAWQMVTEDYFTPAGRHLWRDNLARLFDDFPTQAILFSDFLGQLWGLYPDAVARAFNGQPVETAAFTAWKRALCAHLAGRSWCSTHDRLVTSHRPGVEHLAAAHALSLADLAAALNAAPESIADALTEGIVPAGARQYAIWQRKPDHWHAMEMAWAVDSADHPGGRDHGSRDKDDHP